MKRRVLALMLGALMALALLTACDMKAPEADSTPAPADSGGTSEPAAEGDGEVVHISVLAKEFQNAPTSMDQVTWKTMGEKLNLYCDFEFVNVSDDEEYKQILTLRISSNDLPDLYHAPISTVARYYGQNTVVRTLDDLLESHGQNVLAALESHGITRNAMADDGHFYSIPIIDESSDLECGGFMNKRWMDEVGVTEVPTTTDELYDVLVQFKAAYPDGVPLSRGPWYRLEDQFYRYFGTWRGWIMFDEADGYVYGPTAYKEEMRAALTYLNKLYTEKLLDQEYLTRDDESRRALSINDETGFYITWSDHAPAVCEGGADGTDYVMVPPLQTETGTYTGIKSATGPPFSISANASQEAAEKVMEMLNYMYGEEGEFLFCWGVEGDTYEMVNGEPALTAKVLEHELGALNGRRALGMQPNTLPHISSWDGWAAVLWPQTVEQVEMGLPYLLPQQPVLAGIEEEEQELANIMVDITTYVEDSLQQFVTGARPLSEFDAFIADIEAMGIERAQEINATKFERWQNR